MMRIFLSAVFMIIPAIAMAQTNESIKAQPSDFQWENRILIVIADSESDSLYRVQMQEFKGEENGFDERDLITFTVFRNGKSRLDDSVLNESSAAAIIERYGSGSTGFLCLLIGKDGGVKLEKESPVAVKEIFGLIDSMPMRQREMRQGKER